MFDLLPKTYMDFLKEYPEGWCYPEENESYFLTKEESKWSLKNELVELCEVSHLYPIMRTASGDLVAIDLRHDNKIFDCCLDKKPESWSSISNTFEDFLQLYKEKGVNISYEIVKEGSLG